MVKFCYLLGLWWIGMGILEAAPTIDASIDSMSSQAHFPLEGTLTITHNKEEKIDPQSFELEGKPLQASFVKDVNMSASSNTLVTIYSFQLPAQKKGLYVLPSISVKVGDQTYRTIPSTYEVQETTTTPQPATPSSPTSATPVIFRLEATVKGPTTLYPGQRTKLLYRISYNRSVDLTHSELPMIHPAHFQKIGDVQIRDYQQQDLTIQDLTQEVEASELGTFQLGPSFIEGYAYTMKGDQKVYASSLLKSEAPAISLEVKPFSEPDQPASFTGGLGQIQVEANLLSPPSVTVGDTLQLQVKIRGISNLTELRFPLLQCQPGFSGFFQTSDLPPLAEVQDNTKIFDVELRPLTSLIHEIPPIEVSSFDPATRKYVIQYTSPIALNIHPPSLQHSSPDSKILFTPIPSIDHWPTPILSPLELDDPPAQIQERKVSWIHTPWVLWMLPLGFILLILQKYWHHQWQRRPKPQLPKSEELLQRALQAKSPSLIDLSLIEQAFWQRLWEKGFLPHGNFHLEKLPQEKFEEINSFIFQLQSLQYSLDKEFDPRQLKQQAKYLFAKI